MIFRRDELVLQAWPSVAGYALVQLKEDLMRRNPVLWSSSWVQTFDGSIPCDRWSRLWQQVNIKTWFKNFLRKLQGENVSPQILSNFIGCAKKTFVVKSDLSCLRRVERSIRLSQPIQPPPKGVGRCIFSTILMEVAIRGLFLRMHVFVPAMTVTKNDVNTWMIFYVEIFILTEVTSPMCVPHTHHAPFWWMEKLPRLSCEQLCQWLQVLHTCQMMSFQLCGQVFTGRFLSTSSSWWSISVTFSSWELSNEKNPPRLGCLGITKGDEIYYPVFAQGFVKKTTRDKKGVKFTTQLYNVIYRDF